MLKYLTGIGLDGFFKKEIINSLITRMHQYTLICYPADEVIADVMSEQQCLAERWGNGVVSLEKPHIRLASFSAPEMLEETLIRWLSRICSGFNAFECCFNNFGSSVAGQLQLRIAEPIALASLWKELSRLNSFLESNDCGPVRPVTKPALMVTRDLPSAAYHETMQEYGAKSYYALCTISSLLFIRRAHLLAEPEILHLFGLNSRDLPEMAGR